MLQKWLAEKKVESAKKRGAVTPGLPGAAGSTVVSSMMPSAALTSRAGSSAVQSSAASAAEPSMTSVADTGEGESSRMEMGSSVEGGSAASGGSVAVTSKWTSIEEDNRVAEEKAEAARLAKLAAREEAERKRRGSSAASFKKKESFGSQMQRAFWRG